MPSAAILKIKKAPSVLVPRKTAQAKTPPAPAGFAADAAMRRRELAMLLRSIKTLVRQSP